MARTQTNGKSMSPEMTELNTQIETLKADIAALTQQIGAVAETKAGDLRAQAELSAEQVRLQAEKGADAARALAADARVSAEKTAEQAITAAKANPGTTLGIAAAAGFLVGFMTSRAR